MLMGQWGVADVEDCHAAYTFLTTGESAWSPRDKGRVDGTREQNRKKVNETKVCFCIAVVIMGGSAGGFTTLLSLIKHPGMNPCAMYELSQNEF